jgi:hypothetical protein
MPISIIKQYSVYLANETGSLKGFAELFYKSGIDIIAISQDVRYDAAVVHVAVEEDDDAISHAITKAGYTSVKKDAISLNAPNRPGLIKDIGEMMSGADININSIYGSLAGDAKSRIILVVNNIPKALAVLEKSEIFA